LPGVRWRDQRCPSGCPVVAGGGRSAARPEDIQQPPGLSPSAASVVS
jgi:hypothetical protein